MWGPKRLLRLVLRPKRLLLLRPKLVLSGVRRDAKAAARSGVKSGASGASASEYGLIAAGISVAIIVARVGRLAHSERSGRQARRARRHKFRCTSRYALRRLIEQRGRDVRILDWLDGLTADCPRKRAASVSDQCHAGCRDLPKGGLKNSPSCE